jgi:hypothetical protein
MTKLTPQENATKTRRSRAGAALGLVPVRLWAHQDWINDGGVVSVLRDITEEMISEEIQRRHGGDVG